MYSAAQGLKLVPPRLQLKEVQRLRLLDMLDRAIERPVTLISAGPGSGKNVLVNQWGRSRSHAVVWMSLDQGDDREARSGTLVQYALQHHGLTADRSATDPGRSLAEHATDELADAANRADDCLVLVLDDVRVLSDPEVMG